MNFLIKNLNLFFDMLLFASNLKYLRKATKVSQQDVADFVGIASSAMSGYENEKFYPTVDVLAKLCQFFQINADDLLFKDLSLDSSLNPRTPEIPSVIKDNNVLVPVSDQDKYVEQWESGAYRNLTFINVPGIEGDARTFEVGGNDMNPILTSGDFAICTKSSLAQIQSGKIYAVVSPQKIHWGYVQVQKGRLHCTPANLDEYEAYYIPEAEVREVWEVQRRLTAHLVEPVLGMEARLRTVEEWLKSKFSDELLR